MSNPRHAWMKIVTEERSGRSQWKCCGCACWVWRAPDKAPPERGCSLNRDGAHNLDDPRIIAARWDTPR